MSTKNLIRVGVICESLTLMLALHTEEKYDHVWDKTCEKVASEGRDLGVKDVSKILMKTFAPLWILHGIGCWALGKAIKKS
jgi:hypothetical protein